MTRPGDLTPREIEVLRVSLECYGSSKQAAHRLGITRQTVRNHRQAAYAKLGASGAIEAWARLGWIRTRPDG